MAHRRRSSSVSDLTAKFNKQSSQKEESKPLQKVLKRRHSMSKTWEEKFQVQTHELGKGPMRKTWTNTSSVESPFQNSVPVRKTHKKTNTTNEPQKESTVAHETKDDSKEYTFDDTVTDIIYTPEICATEINKSYETKIETLGTENEILKSEKGKLLKQMKEFECEMLSLKTQMAQCQRENEKLNEQKQNPKKEYIFDDSVTDIIYTPEINATEVNKSYESKIETLDTENEILKSENETLLAEMESLNTSMNEFECEILTVKTEMTQCETENERLNEIMNEQKDINDALAMEVQSLTKESGLSAVLRKENEELRQVLVFTQKSKIDLAMRTDGEMQRLREMVRIACVGQRFGERITAGATPC